MVGIGTVIADDPLLTCRLPGMQDRSPVRIVIDTQLRLPLASQMVKTARQHPVLVFTTAAGSETLTNAGVEIVRVAAADGGVDLKPVMAELGRRGLTRVLVEGGPKLEAALLDAGLADRVHLYRAQHALAGGVPGIGSRITADARFQPFERRELGGDILESFALKG
jgi:diaminohydroxyphosphoribosylaminopyrimidine deaminase/5-amino-6-(5-phosphoribosylamino)uracil reductase